MSAESTQAEGADEVPSILDQHEGVDWLLAYIVGIAEMGVEIGITLTVGGRQISGNVISGRRYFEEVGKGFATSTVNEGMEGLRETLKSGFSAFAEMYLKPDEAMLSANKPNYIHLTNTKYVLANNLTGGGPRSLWRGKLAAVDGFSMGSLERS